MNHLFCFLVLGLAAVASATRFTDCGSTTGKVLSVDVSGCPSYSFQCLLQRGTRKSISIKFQAAVATPVVDAVVHSVNFGVSLPLPLLDNNGCSSGVTCPTTIGGIYTFKDTFDVWFLLLPVPTTLRWELQDINGNDLVCVDIPVGIQ